MTGTIPVTTPPVPKDTDRKRRRRAFWRFFLLFLILGIAGVYAAFCLYFRVNPLQALKLASGGVDVITKRNAPPFGGRDHVNILVLGADVSFDKSGTARTDTIKFVSVDLKTPSISVLSIPRDTWVDIPGHHSGRINGAYQLGGRTEAERVGLASATVSGLLSNLTGEDVQIDKFVRIQTGGFIKIIDALGGVEVNVEKEMNYEDPSQELFIHLKPGLQRLNGYDAMCYARFRHDAESDYGRIRRQNQLMQALAAELSTPDAQKKLVRNIGLLMSMMKTDIAESDMLALKRIVDNIGVAGIYTATLPSEPSRVGEASVVAVKEEEAALAVKEVLNGPRPTVVVLNGSGQVGLASDIREKIDTERYNVTAIGSTTEPAPTTTVIAAPNYRQKAIDLAATLGIELVDTKTPAPTADYGKAKPPASPAQITVVLGTDYAPAQAASTGGTTTQ